MLLTDYCKVNNSLEIIDSWITDLNNRKISEITHSSHYRAHWQCSKDVTHMWITEVYNRIKKTCPYCSNRLVHTSNSLETYFKNNSQIEEMWNKELNLETPDQIIATTFTKFQWYCKKCDHSWKSSPRGVTCPVCTNRILKTGINDFVTKFPKLSKEWSKLNKVAAKEYLPSTKDRVFWDCSQCGGGWNSILEQRTVKNVQCSYCSHQKLLSGYNDFWTKNPQLHSEWSALNTIDPTKIFSNNQDKALWICSTCNRNWTTSIASRAKGSGCIYCNGKVVIPGVNDLLTFKPELAAGLTKTSKNSQNPSKVFQHSTKIYDFTCIDCNQDFQATPLSLTISICKDCKKSKSIGEIQLLKFVKELTPHSIVENTREVIKPYEVDIYIPSLKLGVEYNGDYWHSDEVFLKNFQQTALERHSIKRELAQSQGITLIFVWESDWIKQNIEVKSAINRAVADSTDLDPILEILSKD